ncbi:hypothetical protein [Actinacidiphila oryziradicis]|uniref:hypothetical protein n=1 Tax=Actinacidiphila oryziradicis TaxID=2571141 RepID=UPI00145EDEC1|nr:hypothetical protein [Actinacidiphila oryziradicis]
MPLPRSPRAAAPGRSTRPASSPFTPTSLLLVWLTLLAAHLGGLGTSAGRSGYRRRRR